MRKWFPKDGRDYHNFLNLRRLFLRDECDESIKKNKASSDTRPLPIERFKTMEKEIDIFGNLLMIMNRIMDGKIK
jgi:hypothetical protein